MSFKDLCDAFAEGAKSTVPVAMACACVGIIIGVTSKTGFGLTMANTIITLGNQNLLFTLLFTMMTCMILGMGLPSIPAYIITATIAAPALSKLGIPLLAAHMFAFYFAMFANLTPPVALAAFAAAGLSGGDPMKTGFAAVKLAIAGFIVPYMFIYSPQLLLIDTSLAEGIRVTVGACIGGLMIGVAVEGYLFRKVNALLRLVAFAGALCLIDSRVYSDIVGLWIISGIVLFQKFDSQTNQASAALGVAGFLMGIPLSYFFQSPLLRILPFDEYLKAIPEILNVSVNISGQEGMQVISALLGDPGLILVITCLMCSFLLAVLGYFIERSRKSDN
jgi:TRAP transporter 4TM/12TM fusion protein